MTQTSDSYPTRQMEELFTAILAIKNKQEAANFFRDLLTIPELLDFANRWQMVKRLLAGESYLTIAKDLKTSTTTVTRVAQWLHRGMGGYKLISSRVIKHPKKTSPLPLSQTPKK
jgi:TrpR-related protein YerC/YecD